ncbi:two-component sensor histidine kinase [Erwinia sp. S43]|uniref:sensor histidine kinase n=1 Tax=Erwinia sp. S43 TaxID=2769339 RepID=UPI00190998FC|nr:ATP-binding protein [Erwinia sp. S43]MBK0033194.1 two-component sensor histidine kinase [Erwinia sp. S43]
MKFRNYLFSKNKKNTITLWRWICTRLLSLAIGAILIITSIIWLRYYIPSVLMKNKIPESERNELNFLIKDPTIDINRYHEIIDKWYGLEFSNPDFEFSDWALVISLVMASIPVIIFITLRAVRPLSKHISHLAEVARAVAKGNFGVKVETPGSVPIELNRLTEDLNLMSAQLARYDKELKASHVAIAHELRSPLTAAIGRLQGLIDGVFSPDADQHLMVMRQLQHLNHLVEDLHLLSLARAGELYLNYQKIAINDVVREKVSWLKPKLLELGVEVNIYGEKELMCYADHFRVGQVISILLDNALRYAAEGKIIDLTLLNVDNNILVNVRDYGNGVSDSFLEEMFLRFSRAETSRSRNSGGSGLGLSIADAICHAHHGSISVKKNEDGGLTFTVSLPKDNDANK